MSQFQQPGIANPEDKFNPKENNGALLLFFPTQLQTQIKTEYGESDAVHATVVRLNDGRVFPDALIFSTALITQLRGAIPDGMVLGTLGQGENKKGNPPWLLRPHTEAEVAQAEAWLAANPRNRFSQPTPPPTPAASAPAWGQTPPAPAPAAPATGGWGSPPAPAAEAAPAWGAPAPAPSPAAPAAPAAGSNPWETASAVHPGLVEALRKKGIAVPPGATQEQAEGIWAVKQHDPDVVA